MSMGNVGIQFPRSLPAPPSLGWFMGNLLLGKICPEATYIALTLLEGDAEPVVILFHLDVSPQKSLLWYLPFPLYEFSSVTSQKV